MSTTNKAARSTRGVRSEGNTQAPPWRCSGCRHGPFGCAPRQQEDEEETGACVAHAHTGNTKKDLRFGRYSAPSFIGEVVGVVPKGRLSDACHGQDMQWGWGCSGPGIAVRRSLAQGGRPAGLAAQTLVNNGVNR